MKWIASYEEFGFSLTRKGPKHWSHLAFTSSKTSIETLEKGVKYVLS